MFLTRYTHFLMQIFGQLPHSIWCYITTVLNPSLQSSKPSKLTYVHAHVTVGGTANMRCNTFLHTTQISGLVWSSQHQELLSSHGHLHNELTIWSYPSLSRMASLRGHEARILHLVLSPDGQTVASAGADETLRFWKCFAVSNSKKTEKAMANLSMPTLEMPSYIR